MAGPHGDPEDLFRAQTLQHFSRQSPRFGTEEQRIARLEARVRVAAPATRFDGKHTAAELGETRLKRRMDLDHGCIHVIQPGTSQGALIQGESQGLDEMEPRARVRAQPDDVAGVGRNLRLE
jgi:hypothetical protein